MNRNDFIHEMKHLVVISDCLTRLDNNEQREGVKKLRENYVQRVNKLLDYAWEFIPEDVNCNCSISIQNVEINEEVIEN